MNSSKEEKKTKRTFVGLDWLRFYLAVYLVLFHTSVSYPILHADPWLSPFLCLGNFATTCFFILSGFLLTHIYITNAGQMKTSAWHFFIKRFVSLYPAHLLSFIIIFPLSMFFGHPPVRSVGLLAANATEDMPAVDWLALMVDIGTHLTLTHAWNPQYIAFNIPSWSLSALAFFYLLFPLIAPHIFSKRNPGSLLVLVGLIFIFPAILSAVFQIDGHIWRGIMHRNPVVRFPLFVAGILLYAVYQQRIDERVLPMHGSRRFAFWCLLAGALLCAAQAISLGISPLFVENGLYYLPALLAVWLFATKRTNESSVTIYWAERLGRASLSIIVLHMPLYKIFSIFEKLAAGLSASYGRWHDFQGVVSAAHAHQPVAAAYPIYLIVIVCAAVLFHEQVIDQIQRHLILRWASHKNAVRAKIISV